MSTKYLRCTLCNQIGHNRRTCDKCIICGEYGHDDEQCPLFYSALREHHLRKINCINRITSKSNNICSICNIIVSNNMITAVCGHIFCQTCILSHYESEHILSRYCPICETYLNQFEAVSNSNYDNHIYIIKYVVITLLFIYYLLFM